MSYNKFENQNYQHSAVTQSVHQSEEQIQSIYQQPINNINQNVNNQTIINLNLNYLSFSDDKKLFNPAISSRFDNDIMVFLNFSADMGRKKYMKLNLNKKNMMFNLESNDFGNLFNIIDLTNSISFS